MSISHRSAAQGPPAVRLSPYATAGPLPLRSAAASEVPLVLAPAERAIPGGNGSPEVVDVIPTAVVASAFDAPDAPEASAGGTTRGFPDCFSGQ